MSIREKLKQWKRFAAGATAAVLCAGLLAGCTGKNPAGSSDGTAAQEGPQRYSTIFYDAFDTVTQGSAYCDSEEEFTRQMTPSTPTCWSITSSMISTTTTTA